MRMKDHPQKKNIKICKTNDYHKISSINKLNV